MVSDFDPPSAPDGQPAANGLSQAASAQGVDAQCDPQFAQEWLDRSGLDITQVARAACLSVTQVRQLLHGLDTAFYSPAIRQRAYQRMMRLLGAPDPVRDTVVTQPSRAAADESSPAPHAARLTELTVHQSPQPEQAVSITVDTAARGRITYTAWAWLALVLLFGAATAEWWHGWLAMQVQTPARAANAADLSAQGLTAPAESSAAPATQARADTAALPASAQVQAATVERPR